MILQSSLLAAVEERMPPEMKRPLFSHPPEPAVEALLQPPAISVPTVAPDLTLARRAANLSLSGAKPSTTELERLLGNNDLVDEFFLQRALMAAKPVMRITLRDGAARERGWATGFMVSPQLLLTNWHVFKAQEETTNAIAEANYVLDIAGNPAASYRFAIRGNRFYFANQALDFALVAVEQLAQDGRTPLAQFGYHRLIAQLNKIREGESITIIQHPGGERRQFAIRENRLEKIKEQFIWYKSDTAPGSSGAPAFNDSFQVVALHHSGAAQRDEAGRYVLRDGSTVASLEGVDDSRVNWIANEGLRISVLCAYLRANLNINNPLVGELFQAMQGGDIMANVLSGNVVIPAVTPHENTNVVNAANGAVLTIPLQLQLSLSLGGALNPAALSPQPDATVRPAILPAPPAGTEALRYPIVDRDYTNRTGYDAAFLGVAAPLPEVTNASLVAKMEDGSHEIPYEHFTVVLNKRRRLALFTAANLDYSTAKRRPEPGDYSRDGLTGLGPNDQEKWLTDPRLRQQDQLPDVFYTKDGGAFDKGHVTRREDVCWGNSREQIVRANGDTFHVTNCTPQVGEFNRSALGEDNWGDLENEIQRQAKAEKLNVWAGPIFAEDDNIFAGKDDFGPVNIKIPREYWKIVFANDNGSLAAYAFILQQDLQNLPEEFRVTATWTPYLVSLADLHDRLSGFRFAPAILAADRFSAGGDELASAIGVKVRASHVSHPSADGYESASE